MRDDNSDHDTGKTMIRHVLTSASALLLLSVSTILLWVLSWSHPATLLFTYHQERCRAWIRSGRIGIDNQPEVTIQAAKRDQDMRVMESIGGTDLMVAPASHVAAPWPRSSALLLPLFAVAVAAMGLLPRIVRGTRRRVGVINLQYAAPAATKPCR